MYCVIPARSGVLLVSFPRSAPGHGGPAQDGKEAVVTGTQHRLRQDCEVLLRQIDVRLAALRSAQSAPAPPVSPPVSPPVTALPVPGRAADLTELDAAERVAAALRLLVTETVRASAADRARV